MGEASGRRAVRQSEGPAASCSGARWLLHDGLAVLALQAVAMFEVVQLLVLVLVLLIVVALGGELGGQQALRVLREALALAAIVAAALATAPPAAQLAHLLPQQLHLLAQPALRGAARQGGTQIQTR